MTLFQLEDALVEFIQQNTYDLLFRSNDMSLDQTAPRVWAGFIPRDQVGSIVPGDITTYPAIILNTRRGTQSWESELVDVEVVIGCFDDSLDQQGFRDVTNIVQRIKDRVREVDIIRERFPVRMPLKWEINRFYGGQSSNYFPYFFADMLLTFELPIMTTQYDVNIMDGETTPGRFNQFPIPKFPAPGATVWDNPDNPTQWDDGETVWPL